MSETKCKEREALERALIAAAWGVYALKGRANYRTAPGAQCGKGLDLHIRRHGCKSQMTAALQKSFLAEL